VKDVVSWAQANWRPARDGGPIVLEEHQKRILRHVLTPGPDGRLPYDTIVWSEPKKSGKTELQALVGAYLAVLEPDAEVLLMANDQEQVKSRAFRALTRALRRFPKGAARVLSDRVLLPNGSVVQALPCDWAGEAGGNPSMTGWDELWAYRHEASRRLWDELAPVPTRRNSIRFITTYAGHTGESALLEELYHRGLEGEPVPELADIEDGDGQPACRAVDGMFQFWSHVPRMPWQTEAYYRGIRSAPGFRESAYLRLHQNRWQSPESSFVTPEQWSACQGFVPDVDVGRPRLVAGVDAARRDDTFAITVVARRADRPEDGIAVRAVKVWKSKGGRAIDFAEPFAWLTDLARRAREAGGELLEVTYDEWGIADQVARWGREQGIWTRAFSQAGDRNRADELLFELIASGRLRHGGDEELTTAILNAGWRVSGDVERGRLVKLSPHRKIDGAVALSMAASECLRLNL